MALVLLDQKVYRAHQGLQVLKVFKELQVLPAHKGFKVVREL